MTTAVIRTVTATVSEQDLEVFMVTGNEEILVGQLHEFFYSKLKQLISQEDFFSPAAKICVIQLKAVKESYSF